MILADVDGIDELHDADMMVLSPQLHHFKRYDFRTTSKMLVENTCECSRATHFFHLPFATSPSCTHPVSTQLLDRPA